MPNDVSSSCTVRRQRREVVFGAGWLLDRSSAARRGRRQREVHTVRHAAMSAAILVLCHEPLIGLARTLGLASSSRNAAEWLKGMPASLYVPLSAFMAVR